MAAPARHGRFHLVSSDGGGWCWVYINKAAQEICRSYVYKTKKMAHRGLLNFLKGLYTHTPEIRYKGLLGDENATGYFVVKPLVDKLTLGG